MIVSAYEGLPESEPRATVTLNVQRGGYEEEADTVKGDPADARQAGAVPGCRRGGEQRPIQPSEVPQFWAPELRVRLARVRGRRAKATHVHVRRLRTHSQASISTVSALWLAV